MIEPGSLVCVAQSLPSPPPPVVSLLSLGLPPRTFAWTVSSELLGFCFYFSLFFVSVRCARLSHLVNFLAHVNLPYCIVSIVELLRDVL